MDNKLSIKVLRRVVGVIMSIMLLLSCAVLSGCENNNFPLYFGINEMPKNVDPQKASSYSELLVVRNCFRGLMKQDINGDIVCDIAENYSANQNYTEYTFNLKDVEWRNGTAVTSDDFVFAISRAADPATASPYAHLISNILGVEQRLSGDLSAELGIVSINSKTFKIKLVKPDKMFITKLTQSVFMPCNREFFESCSGKYGLGKKFILSNGEYHISQWVDNRHIKLTLCDVDDSNKRFAENVFLTVSAKGKNNVDRIIDKEIGMTADSVNDYTLINSSEYNIETVYSKTYALVFNQNTEVGSNKILTEAFAQSVHRELYSVKMSDRFKTAYTVIPPYYLFNGQSVSGAELPKHSFDFNPEKARQDFLLAIKTLSGKKLPNIKVLTVDNSEIKSALNNIVSQWQSNLGAYVNINTVSSEDLLLKKIISDEYTIALIPLSGDVKSILEKFCNPSNGLYIDDDEFISNVKILNSTDDYNTAVDAIAKCAKILSSQSFVIPIISVPTAYIYSNDYNNVKFSALDGTVDFSIIYKTK